MENENMDVNDYFSCMGMVPKINKDELKENSSRSRGGY